MAAPQKCPRCGAAIPGNSPGGACPACALRDALGLGAYDAGNVDPHADTIPMHVAEKERSRISQTISFQRRVRKILQGSRWVVACFFIVLIGYTVARHAWMNSHIRPAIFFTDELSVAFDAHQLGVAPESVVRTVNGVAVQSPGDVAAAYDSRTRLPFDFTFHSQDPARENRRVTYQEVDPMFAYAIDSQGVADEDRTSAALTSILEPQERIVAINGVPLTQLTDSGSITSAPPFDNRVISYYKRFTVRNMLDGSEREIVLGTNARLRERARLLGGIGFLAIGLLVFWLRSDTRSSAGFLLFCAVVGIFFLCRSISLPHRTAFESGAYFLFQCLVPAAAVILLVSFTPLRLLVRRAAPTVITCLALALVFLLANSYLNPAHASLGILSTGAFRAWSGLILIVFLLSLPMDLWARLLRIPVSPTDKQRSRTLRIAFVLGLAPLVIYTAVAFWVPGWANEAAPLVDVSVLTFPALLGYAIVRHNFLRLNELAREGVLYGLLMALLTGVYVTGTAVLVPLAQSYLPQAGGWTQSLVLAGAMAAIIPVHSATRRIIDRRFKRIPFEFEEFIAAIEREGVDWHGPVDYCHTVAVHLSRMVDTAHITLLTHYPNQDDWTISASTEPSDPGRTSESCKMLCALLEQERTDVFRDDVLEGFRYRVIQREILEGLEALDASIVVPLVTRGHVIGAISLGDKSGNANYSAGELNTLKRIAGQVAGTLYNLMTLTGVQGGTRIADIWPDWPERIGGYNVERPVGEGGMAYVFLGRRDSRPYAIKVANRLVQANSRLMERFHREASTIQRLDHPHIVKIVEVGWEGPEPYIVFEYFKNGSLEKLVDPDKPLDIPSVMTYALQIASALKYADEHGVIHRDIKPRNLFLDDDNNIKLGDFGLARMADRTTLTLQGEFFGTPDYLAPELLKGGKSSVQTDMYALGVTIFELAAGRRPFVGESDESIVHQRMHADSPRVRTYRPDATDAFDTLVSRMLNADPALRHADYGELLADLHRVAALRVTAP